MANRKSTSGGARLTLLPSDPIACYPLDVATKVPLFKTCSPAGTIALVQNLFPSIILPGELIIQQVCRYPYVLSDSECLRNLFHTRMYYV